ncbi:DUF4154 domain-containing protein [bacterium]|nr:DUF4154 domain-containing protein [bacterium]
MRTKPVLLVDDLAQRVSEGVHIGLKIRNNKVRFDINREAFEESRLEVDFRLLQLADRVIP